MTKKAVIIGAGYGGPAPANFLAKAGGPGAGMVAVSPAPMNRQ